MKHFLFLVTLLSFSLGIHAQNKDLKNEIGVSYGLGISTIGDGIGSAVTDGVFDAMTGREWANDKSFGTLSVEYFRHMDDPKLAVGGIATVATFSHDLVKKNTQEKMGDRMRTYISLMPAVRYAWVNKNHFAFYSKLAGGVMLLYDKRTYSNLNTSSSDTNFRFMFQISPLGVEFGGKFRVFLELGIGEQGIALAGAKYKF